MLNWPRVEDLRNEVGEDAFGEVVDLFLEEVGDALTRLADDPAALEQKLHFLKGAALTLGMDEFAQLCSLGERAARDGRDGEIDLIAICDAYDRARRSFLARAQQAGFLAA